MLSICIWDYWCPQKGWTILRWQGMCSEAPMEGWCKLNPIQSKMPHPQMIHCYTVIHIYLNYSSLHRVHSLCLAMAERREEGRSAPSIALGSCEQAVMFQDASTQRITSYFETSFQLEGSMVGECLAWTSYFWGFHTCYSIWFFCLSLKRTFDP